MANCLICGRGAGFLSEVCSECKEKRSPGSSGKPTSDVQVSSLGLLRDAVSQIYEHRRVLLLAAALPILCSLAIRQVCVAYVCSAESDPSPYITYLFHLARLPFYVMFATICHRVVLLGGSSLTSKWGLFWSMRETRFLGWLFVLGAIVVGVSLPISYLFWYVVSQLPDSAFEWLIYSSPFSASFYTCVLASTYIDGRFGLVLPATAVGRPTSPLRSWRFTAGNGWPIFVALMIPILLTDLIDYILFVQLIDAKSTILDIVRSLIYYPLIAVGVVVITIAYRNFELSQDEELTRHHETSHK